MAHKFGWRPIWDTFRDSGSNLAESLATLITVIVSIVPWLVVIVPGFWVLAKYWRHTRRKKNVIAPNAALLALHTPDPAFAGTQRYPGCVTIK